MSGSKRDLRLHPVLWMHHPPAPSTANARFPVSPRGNIGMKHAALVVTSANDPKLREFLCEQQHEGHFETSCEQIGQVMRAGFTRC